MALFLATLAIVALCVVGLGVNVFFRKKDFPQFDVGSNEEMRKKGIRCFKDEDADLHGHRCEGGKSEACNDCKFKKI